MKAKTALLDLLQRVRPGSEAAPWVIEELKAIAKAEGHVMATPPESNGMWHCCVHCEHCGDGDDAGECPGNLMAYLVMYNGKVVGYCTKDSVSLARLAEGETLVKVYTPRSAL